MEPVKKAGQPVLNKEQSVREQGRRIVGAVNGDLEYDGQQQEHQRKSCQTAGEQPVDGKIQFTV